MHERRLVAAIILCGACLAWSASFARDLTFEERVRAQEAIERVYYSHQIGASRSFAEAVPRSRLQEKVRAYLRQSLALERFWKTPLTTTMLRSEVERMARGTLRPDRLRELFAALGDDPFLIQECLARPLLSDRLTRNFFAFDQDIHGRARAAAEQLRQRLLAGQIDPNADHPARVALDLVRIDGHDDPPSEPNHLRLPPEEFEIYDAMAPGRVGEAGPIREERDSFSLLVTLTRGPGELRLARFAVGKVPWEEWWRGVAGGLSPESVRAVAASGSLDAWSAAVADAGPGCADDSWSNGSLDDVPDPRSGASVVWTGSVMIVWGGQNDDVTLSTGGRYDPATDTWSPISAVGAPVGRSAHSTVWTGSEMIVWGGSTLRPNGGYTNTGGRYDPATDTWTPTSTAGAPFARARPTAVWTGNLMVVWGGTYTDTGGRYDPATDTWTPTSTIGAPTARTFHKAVWTGSLMVIWGGVQNAIPVTHERTGGRYDPVSDTWIPTSTLGAPQGRTGHSTVWTGAEMIVWGGQNSSGGYLGTGGLYNPVTDIWMPTSVADAPSPRVGHTAVWTGSEMIVWGSVPNAPQPGTGGRYDPRTNRWMPTSTVNAPSARSDHAAVWTGERMVVWGGSAYSGYTNTGGRYDPTTDTWTPTSTGAAPIGRQVHSAVWTGNVMIVWGGDTFAQSTNTGGKYDPATDSWAPTSMTGVPPSPPSAYTAVWTGDAMIVFGGQGFVDQLMSGGRYDPVNDSWAPMNAVGAPSSRVRHTAIWTGSKMVVWGGAVWNPSTSSWTYLDTGGRYDPATDAWTPTSVVSAPTGRHHHSAVWTGTEMIVWGGHAASTGIVASGAKYDPDGDRWTPTSTANAPPARVDHTAVWTGSEMVVWGGESGAFLTSGGRYDPSADRWQATSLTGVPSARWHHSVVWTGRLMIVWGGWLPAIFPDPVRLYNTGGRYDPVADIWSPTSVDGAASARRYHTATWTGDSMIIWGGANGGFSTLNSGGRYCLCTPRTFYHDADGDGLGDPSATLQSCVQPPGYVDAAGDCDDGDAGVWGTPGEAENLLFASDSDYSWGPPVQPGGTAVVYDVLRSGVPDDFVAAAACVATDVPVTTAVDPALPTTGALFFYLVRAENGCPAGQGSLGKSSDGALRAGRSCP